MTDDIRKIVTGLPELESVTGVWKVAGRRLARGDAAFVADLGIALAQAYGSGAARIWQYRSVFDHVLRLLATTPGPGTVTQTLRLVTAPPVTDRYAAYTASLLASCHPATELTVAFTGHASEELRACLVHELVLRDVPVTATPGIADWATSPHWRYHPLGRLPLELTDVEGRPDLPAYSVNGSSHAMPYGPSGNRGVTTAAEAPVPRAEETTTDAVAGRIGAAVANWAEESNGRTEARVFALTGPAETESVPALLPTLGLACLTGTAKGTARGRAALSVSFCPPDQAWRVLFAAASTGGAYNPGLRGAYGRLAAWRSLGGLAGAAEHGTAEETAAHVRESTWYGVDAGTAWFAHVAWDIGLAALSPDRRRLAVLAATDTD